MLAIVVPYQGYDTYIGLYKVEAMQFTNSYRGLFAGSAQTAGVFEDAAPRKSGRERLHKKNITRRSLSNGLGRSHRRVRLCLRVSTDGRKKRSTLRLPCVRQGRATG